MLLEGFEKISKNTELLIIIYKLLDFEDQIRLACASTDLSVVFSNFYYKEPLGAQETATTSVVHDMNGNLAVLEPRDTDVIADSIQELTQRFLDPRPFRNLTCLTYEMINLPSDHLQCLSSLYPNLQCLNFLNCRIAGAPIQFDKNLRIETLAAMKNLKHFCSSIRQRSRQKAMELDYTSFRKLSQLRLYSLALVPISHLKDYDIQRNLSPQKQLTIAFPIGDDKYFVGLKSYENLAALSLLCTHLTNYNISVFAGTCKNLEILNFHSSFFVNIRSFVVPYKLSQLSFHACKGLSHSNLKQILTRLKITKFSSKFTRFEGEFVDFQISPLITTLSFDSIYSQMFQSFYQSNRNLEELILHEYLGTDTENSRDTSLQISLGRCTNLRSLTTKGNILPSQTLLRQINLKTLYISMADGLPSLKWNYIMSLLRHPSLTELTIMCNFVDQTGHSELPEEIRTDIKLVIISIDIFLAYLTLWLDLFNRNHDLKLVCTEGEETGENEFHTTLESLIYHETFPKDMDKINICGVTKRCKDIKKNFNSTMTELAPYIDHYKSFDCPRKIILYRKQ